MKWAVVVGLALGALSSIRAEALVVETRTFLSIDPLVSSATYEPGGGGFVFEFLPGGVVPGGLETDSAVAVPLGQSPVGFDVSPGPIGSAGESFALSGGFVLVTEVYEWGETWLRFDDVRLSLSPGGRESEFSLPRFLLRWSPDGSVYGDGNPCSTPLYPGTSRSGHFLGRPPSFSGIFDGTTLTVSGRTGRAQIFDPEFTYRFTARVEPVPAPASGLLAVAGVAALGLLRRRRAAGRRSRG